MAIETTVRIREGKYLVPDLIAQRRDAIQDPYPTEPVFLCVEILSPGDRFSDVIAKCEDYHTWGVEHTWMVDPDERRAWHFHKGQRPEEIPAGGSLTAGELTLALANIFSVLD